MKEGLKYILRNEVNEELDNLFILSLINFKKYDGQKCVACGVIQGSFLKGWKQYYCRHIEKLVNKTLKEKEEKIKNKFFLLNADLSDQKAS